MKTLTEELFFKMLSAHSNIALMFWGVNWSLKNGKCKCSFVNFVLHLQIKTSNLRSYENYHASHRSFNTQSGHFHSSSECGWHFSLCVKHFSWNKFSQCVFEHLSLALSLKHFQQTESTCSKRNSYFFFETGHDNNYYDTHIWFYACSFSSSFNLILTLCILWDVLLGHFIFRISQMEKSITDNNILISK